MTATAEKKCLSVTEAAVSLGVCNATILRAIRRKELKAVRLNAKKNGSYLIPVAELNKLLAGK